MPRMTERLSPVQIVRLDQLGFAINFGTIPYKTQMYRSNLYIAFLSGIGLSVVLWNITELVSLLLNPNRTIIHDASASSILSKSV